MICLKIDNTLIITAIAVLALIVIAIVAIYVIPSNSVKANTSETNGSQPLSMTDTGTVPTADPAILSGEPANNTSRPELISWFGSVTDSFGKPYGGLYVTLHLMTPAGEAYNMTTKTYSELPYPGSYVFDNVEITPDLTYAYVTASADIGDGVQYYGSGENYSLNRSRIAAGFVVLHVPMPDQINVTVDNSTLSQANVAFVNNAPSSHVNSTLITAQLFYNGNPYKRSGVTVTFFGDDDSIVVLPGVKTNVTDESGRTSINLTAMGGPGTVNVTGYTKIGISRNLTDTCMVTVVE